MVKIGINTMENQKSHFQVLFLIDTYLNDSNHYETISRYNRMISLSIFRILKTLLATENPLSWCYKFYSSNSDTGSLRKVCLTDFKLKHFEEFEKQLQDKLEAGNSSKCQLSQVSNKSNNTCVTGNRRKVKCHAESLKDALTEIVTDIPWESDRISPVKKGKLHLGKQTRSNAANTNHFNKQLNNFVFLFTRSPHDKSSLRNFAGKRVIDSDVLLDSFMTPSLQTRFSQHSHLALIWVDTSCLHETHQNITGSWDPESLQIVESAVAALDGAVFSIDSIVSISYPWPCGKFSLKTQENQSSVSENVNRISLALTWPTTTLLGHFVYSSCQNHCETTIQGSLALNLIDDKISAEIYLELVPTTEYTLLTRSQSSDARLLQSQKREEFVPVTVKTVSTDETKNKCEELKLNIKDDFNDVSRTNFELQNPRFSVIACIDRSAALSQMTEPVKSYIAYNRGEPESVSLSKLLQEMAKLGQILVLRVEDRKRTLSSLAVLDLHTLHSASISVLSVGSSLQVEKLMLKHIDVHNKNQTLTDKDAGMKESDNNGILTPTISKERANRIQVYQTHIKDKTSVDNTSGRKSDCVSRPHYNPQVLNSWHVAGSSKALVNVIGKLTERIDQLNFLTSSEKQVLKNVQQLYRKQNRPVVLQHPKTSPPVTEDTKVTDSAVVGDVKQKKSSLCKKKSGLFRGELMVKRSRAAVKEGQKPEEKSNKMKNTASSDKAKSLVHIPKMEFETESDLGLYLKDLYRKLVEEGGSLEFGVQTVVTVSLHFMKNQGRPEPEKSCVDLLKEYVLLSAPAVKEKYKDKESSEDNNNKITEFKLQILLRLELESAVLHTDNDLIDKYVDEIVSFLRSLTFITDSGFVPTFLNRDLLTSYSSTLPKLLVSIYDELMQPLPDSLAAFGSPQSSSNLSVLDRSCSSHLDDSLLLMSQPLSDKSDILQSQSSRTLRSRKLSHHPSLDFGAKKQIVVMKPVVNKKDKKPTQSKGSQLSTRSRKEKEKVKQKSDVVKVRRNLFDGDRSKLERRQSVTVTERVRRSPRKKLSSLFKSPQSSKSPRLRKKVAETPTHRQTSHAARRKSETVEDIQVVSESPLKTSPGNLSKYSPARSKHAINMLRRSFYSAQPRSRSRNLSKYMELARKIGGSHRLSSSQSQSTLDSSGELVSPTNQSTFLFSQLVGSPSPQGKFRKDGENSHKQTIEDSPFKNTRSKTPKKKFTRMLSFDSPQNKKLNQRENESQGSHSLHETPKKPQTRSDLSCSRLVSPSSEVKLSDSPEHLANDVNISSFAAATTPVRSSRNEPFCNRTPVKTNSADHDEHRRLAEEQSPDGNVLESSTDNPRSSRTSNTSQPFTPQTTTSLTYFGTPKRRTISSFFKSFDSKHKCSDPVKCGQFSPQTVADPSTPSRQETNSNWTNLQSTPIRSGKSPSGTDKSPVTPLKTPKSCLVSPRVKSPFILSPDKRVHFEKDEVRNVCKNLVISNTGDKPLLQKLCNEVSVNSKTTSPDAETRSKNIQRTPSPSKRKPMKTPDSLDKWPRKKKRWVSPTEKLHVEKDAVTDRDQENRNLCSFSLPANNSEGFIPGVKSEGNGLEKPARPRPVKRSLQSPLTPCRKRPRMSLSEAENDIFGCYVISNVSLDDSDDSVDAEAALLQPATTTNGEVILPNTNVPLNSELQNKFSENHIVSCNDKEVLKNSKSSSCCNGNQTAEGSDSPTFHRRPSRQLTRLKSKEESENDTSKPSFDSELSQGFVMSESHEKSEEDHSVLPSPTVNRKREASSSKSSLSSEVSPQQVKFSPVSARSLIHLMHSPLIQSSQFDSNGAETDGLQSPHRHRHITKSKKMLNLQN